VSHQARRGQLTSRRFVLVEQPVGRLTEHCSAVRVAPVPHRRPDKVLIRVIFARVPSAARAVTTTTTPFPRALPGDGISTAVLLPYSARSSMAPGAGRRPGPS
jgi:hypothetical protein